VILVVAGTLDGRQLASYLKERGLPVAVSVTTGYGGELAAAAGEVIVDRMEREDFIRFFARTGSRVVVDASHPYAAGVSRQTMQAARAAGVFYIRYERAAANWPAYSRLRFAADAGAAAAMAAEFGPTVFLTIGSRALPLFKNATALAGKRLVARILPEVASLNHCRELGFAPRDIIAMQGPFSQELNKAMFRDFAAAVVVTKDSGQVGGAEEKVRAAAELDLPVIVIKRPVVRYERLADSFAQVYELIRGVENGVQ
jgi:precorrin-6A/cobalt-precorrin-6A reductase